MLLLIMVERDEITKAVQKIAKKVQNQEIK